MTTLRRRFSTMLVTILLATWPSTAAQEMGDTDRAKSATTITKSGSNGSDKYTTFTSTDAGFRFGYPVSFALYAGKGSDKNSTSSYIPVCHADSTACVMYPSGKYEGTNFGAAAFEAGEIVEANTEQKCLTFEALQIVRDSDRGPRQEYVLTARPIEKINGIAFRVGRRGGAALGHLDENRFYRTFHNGRCYELSTNITWTSWAAFPPGTVKRFTEKDEKQVFQTLKQILDSFELVR
jgi:hypothetical protein